MTTHTVSVIVPVRDGERFLPDAVRSIRTQDHAEVELVIVDDASTDSTPRIIESLAPDVALRLDDGSGPAAARNAGLASSSGAIVGFLDADDTWATDSLPHRLGRLDANTDLVIGATRPPGATSDDGGRDWILLSLGAALVRRSCFDAVGTFDESLRFGEDVDWFLRAREAGLRFRFTDQVAQTYRRHADNMTNDTSARDSGFLATMKRSLDRRRAHAAAAEHMPSLSGLDELDLRRAPAPVTRNPR